MAPNPSIARLLLAAGLLVLASCGAGLITGAISSNSDGTSRPPAISLIESRLPLRPTDSLTGRARSVAIANLQVPLSATVEVLIRAAPAGATLVVAQDSPTVRSGAGGSTTIGFNLNLEPFVAASGGAATLRDLPAELLVRVDGRQVGGVFPVTLVRQAVAALEQGDRQALSALGETRARLRVTGLLETHPEVRAEDLQMSVTTADAVVPGETSTRLCANLTIEVEASGALIVAADVPGNTFAGPATLVVDDPLVAGRSTVVVDTYYEPSVTVALPAQGPTSGGSRVTLIGRAMAPIRVDGDAMTAAFEDLEILFRKGDPEREVPLSSALITDRSSLDQLTFTMPPSPDGRPGQVDIVLRTTIRTANEVLRPEVVAGQVFLFGNPRPVFGPRGAVLDRQTIAVAQVGLDDAPRFAGAPDFAVLFAEGGVASLQLLMAEENGMFIRFGPARQIGDPEVPAEREPRDLVAADFDADGLPDLAILNAGSPAQAILHVVLGQSSPAPPLGPTRAIPIPANMARCRVGDLDGDGVADLVLMPGRGAAVPPQVLLTRSAPGSPGFVLGAPVPVRVHDYDELELADIDGDGLLDVAVAVGGATPRLDVAYGDGLGGFGSARQLDFVNNGAPGVPFSRADVNSPVVGLHMVRFQPLAGPLERFLVLSFAGLPASLTTPPVVVTVPTLPARTLVQPIAANVLRSSAVLANPIGRTLVADIGPTNAGRQLSDELVVASLGDNPSEFQLAPLSFNGDRFDLDPSRFSVQEGGQELRSISALSFGTAFPASPTQREARALFVVHEGLVDGVRERRLSTMLVFIVDSPQEISTKLLTADLGFPVNVFVRSVVGGRFHADATDSTLDLALAGLPADLGGPEIRLQINDGFGGVPPPFGSMSHPTLLAETLVGVPADGGVDRLAFLTSDGSLGLWRSEGAALNQQPTQLSPDLRLLSPIAELVNTPLSAESRLRVADLDGDGLQDLAALLVFDVVSHGEGTAMLLALMGDPNAGPEDFPFLLPETPQDAQIVHGNASDVAVGDFVLESAGRLLEMAVPVPVGTEIGNLDGDHVRFYRLQPASASTRARWVRSFSSGQGSARVLLAGSAPTLIGAADFDGNGTDDLVVAAADDSTLRLFLNSGLPATSPAEVAIEAFVESFSSPRPIVPGAQVSLNLGDINGDGNVDVLLTTTSPGGVSGELSSSVAFYLSSGTGEISDPSFVSQSRLGNRDARIAVTLGDFNGDGVPDLPVGWDTTVPNERNTLILFGGSR